MSTATTLRRITAVPDLWLRWPSGMCASFQFLNFDRLDDYLMALQQDGERVEIWPANPTEYREAIQVDSTGTQIVGAEVEPLADILDDAHEFEHVGRARGEWRDLFRVRYAGCETYYLAR